MFSTTIDAKDMVHCYYLLKTCNEMASMEVWYNFAVSLHATVAQSNSGEFGYYRSWASTARPYSSAEDRCTSANRTVVFISPGLHQRTHNLFFTGQPVTAVGGTLCTITVRL